MFARPGDYHDGTTTTLLVIFRTVGESVLWPGSVQGLCSNNSGGSGTSVPEPPDTQTLPVLLMYVSMLRT